MRTQEQLFVVINSAPVSLQRYTLGYDDVVQDGETRNVYFFAVTGFAGSGMYPPIIYTYNKVFNVVRPFDYSNFIFGLGNREEGKDKDSGFLMWEYPLMGFIKDFQFKKQWHFHSKIDFSKSYYRVLNAATITTPYPFVIPLYFEMFQ